VKTSSGRIGRSRAAIGALALIVCSAAGSGACAKGEAPDASEAGDAHIQAISSASADLLTPQYAGSARLEWIGGPLDGAYEGAGAINAVWSRFIAGRGTMKAYIQSYVVAENPNGRTVIASIVYRGDKTIPVRLITTYRDGMIASEIWQIDPAMLD
jgi:hypothetical protein